MNWVEKELHGWGRYPRVACLTTRPERRSEALEALAEAARAHQGGSAPSTSIDPQLAKRGSGALVHGLGRSYGDSALLRDGHVVLSERLDQLLEFDPTSGLLRCQAGTSIDTLIDVFLPRGFFPPVVPGTRFVTVGGAIANDIHGKNHHVDGTFTDHVSSFEILTAAGEVVTASREHEPGLFHATVGGLGLTGMILSAELTLTPVSGPWLETEVLRIRDLDHFFEVSGRSSEFTHAVSWIDTLAKGRNLGRGLFMRGRAATAGQVGKRGVIGKLPLTVPVDLPGWLLNSWSLKAFNELYYRKQFQAQSRSIVHYQPWFFPLDFISHWNRAYGRRGLIQYQIVLPPDPTHRPLRSVVERIAGSGMGSFLAVIKEFGLRDHGGLTFPMPGVTLALDFPNYGAPLFELLDQVDRLVADAGGRVYLGKDARMSADMFRAMYPGWSEWKVVRDTWDPDGLFQSELGRRLGLVGST